MKFLFQMLTVAFACSAAASSQSPEDVFEIPFTGSAPAVDGCESTGEWKRSFRVNGAGTPVDQRRSEIAFAWDRSHLYVLAKSETAPRNMLCTSADSAPGSKALVHDDSVELWFDPPKSRRTADGSKRLGFFQMIVSHNGNSFGRHHNPGYGLPARDWNLDSVKKAWRVTNDVWTLEMAIPANAFGLAEYAEGDFPVLAVRNFRLGGGVQSPFLRPDGEYTEPQRYRKIRLAGRGRERTVDRRPAGLKPFVWNTPETSIVAEGGTRVGGASCGVQAGLKIPVPGAIVLHTKTSGPMKKKGWRRYFSTRYQQNGGYLGFQEDTNNGRCMMFFTDCFAGDRGIAKRMKCPADGREAVVAVNIEPGKVTYWLNGVKQGETDIRQDLSREELGELVIGGGEPGLDVLQWTLYGRTLSDAEVKSLSQGDAAASGSLSWYPSLNAIVADLTIDASKVTGERLPWRVVRSGRSGTFAAGEIPLSEGIRQNVGGKSLVVVRKVLPIGKTLPDGDYVASVGAGDDTLMESGFSMKRYDWIGNSLGKEERLLPGFTPVAAKGAVLTCVGREYAIGDNGFPERIVADGRQILAAPVALHAEKGGRFWTLGGGRSKTRRRSDTRAEYVARADGYTVKGSLEQDGLLRFTIRFLDAPKADRVWLEIPVKKEFATLYHACGEGTRANPAGFVPPGIGAVFKSRCIPQTHVSNFIPYCWVGTDTRGIAYAADTDFGWAHSKSRDAVELVRKTDGTVSVVLNILNAPYEAGEREIELALMASPVKPMPKGWRGWSDDLGCKGTQVSRGLHSNPYWGCYTGWAARYPAWGDFGYVRKLREAMDTGKIDRQYVAKWVDRVCASTSAETAWVNRKPPEEKREYVKAHTESAFASAASLHGKPNPIMYFYTCDADSSAPLAEHAEFRDEWPSARTSCPSYADYAIWYLDKMLEAGMTGVYDDNTFLCCSFNWASGDAKVDRQGVVHPSFGMWATREYRRRQANVLAARGLFPWITVHHTNANILPVLGFAANSMGMEWKYGSSDFQTRFTPDYIRAVCQGLQGGFFPTALDGVTGLGGEKNRAERARVTRTMLASLLVHEVRPVSIGSDRKTVVGVMSRLSDFGIHESDCAYTAYWDEANPVASSAKDVLVSVYRRGDRMLAVCAGWADGERQVELSLKGGVFERAKNAETGAAIPIRDGKARFRLAKHDLALVELEAGRPALPPDPFPDRMSAFVWRNWFCVDAERLAKTVGAQVKDLEGVAAEMGLPVPQRKVLPQWRRKGYITVLRRNWHLLPYRQLLTVLDMTREELDFCLKEDDFLFVKLGSVKPVCGELSWNAAAEKSPQLKAARAKIADALRKAGADDFSEEPRFSFIDELKSVDPDWRPREVKDRAFDPRILFSYCADYGDPLADAEISTYPEGLLQKLAGCGIDAVWLHAVLYQLAGDPKYPELGRGAEKRCANLRRLVERAKKYGVRVMLYMNEPRALPDSFFSASAERESMRGAKGRDGYSLCLGSREGGRLFRSLIGNVFRSVPGLGGIMCCTASENQTNCGSHDWKDSCPRCRNRTRREIIAEANSNMVAAVSTVAPGSFVSISSWGWPPEDVRWIFDHVPRDGAYASNTSEAGLEIVRGGVRSIVGEYSISAGRPSPRSLERWRDARALGFKTEAAALAGSTWEFSTIPYLPAMDLVAEHAFRLKEADVTGVSLSWTLGCYPSPNLRLYTEMTRDVKSPGEMLDRVAAEVYGANAVSAVRRAWKTFSDGFREYPFHMQVVYNAPLHLGAANPLYPKKTGWESTMVGLPYDDLKSWRWRYPENVFVAQMEKVRDGFAEGCRAWETVVAACDGASKTQAARELGTYRAATLTFASVVDQCKFVMARDAGDRAGMLECVRREKATALALLPLVRSDSRIGYECSNHYFFIPQDLREKILCCTALEESLMARW